MFGLVLQDPRHGENGLYGTSGVLFIPGSRTDLVEQLREEMKSGQLDFLKMYRLFGQNDHLFNFTPFQLSVLDLVQQYLADHGYKEELVMPMLSAFLMENEVKAKNPGAVAAGAIQVSYDFQLIGSAFSTLKEVGAYFSVSPATVAKYRDQVGDFMLEAIEKDSQMKRPVAPAILQDMGTDPRGTERFMWEMVMRTKQQSFDSAESLNAFMSGKMTEAYEPANDAERVQWLCYQAYEAETQELRNQLANEAASIDPEATDVHLLLTEQADHPVIIENHYLKAIRSASKEFDRSFDLAWNFVLNRPYLRSLFSYGAWLMTEGRHDEALEKFKEIIEVNPIDHQGAHLLLISAFLRLGMISEAELTFVAGNPAVDDAVAHYLKMTIEKQKSKKDVTGAYWKRAEKLNSHVLRMLSERNNPGEFPRSLILQPGGLDEAKLIYWLIHGLL